jgi:hypothetical protein
MICIGSMTQFGAGRLSSGSASVTSKPHKAFEIFSQ